MEARCLNVGSLFHFVHALWGQSFAFRNPSKAAVRGFKNVTAVELASQLFWQLSARQLSRKFGGLALVSREFALAALGRRPLGPLTQALRGLGVVARSP